MTAMLVSILFPWVMSERESKERYQLELLQKQEETIRYFSKSITTTMNLMSQVKDLELGIACGQRPDDVETRREHSKTYNSVTMTEPYDAACAMAKVYFSRMSAHDPISEGIVSLERNIDLYFNMHVQEISQCAQARRALDDQFTTTKDIYEDILKKMLMQIQETRRGKYNS
ncbi:hypothetical protein [Nitratidesulfovibrio sp. 1201_IL3209]|uniref:hypothetical protein n=1 Tax=Nitratidesulfovibrio sp. 1201_IL3209 TaxID=3084053 RepID=UPI002FDA545C